MKKKLSYLFNYLIQITFFPYCKKNIAIYLLYRANAFTNLRKYDVILFFARIYPLPWKLSSGASACREKFNS